MKTSWLLCMMCALAVVAVRGATNPDEVKYSIGSRSYYVVNPKSVPATGAKAPLLLFLHGMNCACAQASETYNLRMALQNAKFTALVVSVCAVSGTWDNSKTGGDQAFVKNVIADVSKKYNVDSSRVFAEGFSMGGMMVSVIGCATGSSVFSLGFSMNGCGIQCSGLAGPVHVLSVEGKQDNVCPYSHSLSSYNSWKTFAAQEKCADSTSLATKLQKCSGKEVDFYYVEGGHTVIEDGSFSGSAKSVAFMQARIKEMEPTTNLCATNNGGCGDAATTTCAVNGDTVKCACKSGFTGNPPTTACTAPPTVNLCATNNGGCGDAATTTCAVNGDAVTCACKSGFAGNPPTTECKAVTVDLCATDNGGCGDAATTTCAVNGDGVKCACKSGFTGNPPTTECTSSGPATCFVSATDEGSNQYWIAFNVKAQADHTIKTVEVISEGKSTTLGGPFNWGSDHQTVYASSITNGVKFPFTMQVTDAAGAVNTFKIAALGAASYTCA